MRLVKFILLNLVIVGCATMQPINQELASRNLALVKNTVFNPLLGGIKAKSATLKTVDEKPVVEKSSYEIPAGEHSFSAKCEYYETSMLILTGEHTFSVKLERGHTYKLIPVPARNNSTNELMCFILIEDLTKI